MYDLDDHITHYTRRTAAIHDIARLETDRQLTRRQKLAVCAILMAHKFTRADFQDVDELPGKYGYEVHVDGQTMSWHWKLRQTRNDHTIPLYETLTTTEK